jgi:hypothetical protein
MRQPSKLDQSVACEKKVHYKKIVIYTIGNIELFFGRNYFNDVNNRYYE